MAQAQSIAPLPRQVVAEDHRLEKAAAATSVALMKHRWHWTLDESNANRVSVAQYAREVGRAHATISLYARAHDTRRRTSSLTPDEALERARMSSERYEATQAVAKARGISIPTAVRTHRDEVRRVRDAARERAEQKGTSISQELPRAAEWNVKAERAAKQEKEERRERHGVRFVEVEGKLQDAKRKIVDAIGVSLGVEFDREERDLLLDAVGEVQEAVQLARTAIGGKAGAEVRRKFEVLKGGLSA